MRFYGRRHISSPWWCDAVNDAGKDDGDDSTSIDSKDDKSDSGGNNARPQLQLPRTPIQNHRTRPRLLHAATATMIATNGYLQEFVQRQFVVHASLVRLDDESCSVGGQAEVSEPRGHEPGRVPNVMCAGGDTHVHNVMCPGGSRGGGRNMWGVAGGREDFTSSHSAASCAAAPTNTITATTTIRDNNSSGS